MAAELALASSGMTTPVPCAIFLAYNICAGLTGLKSSFSPSAFLGAYGALNENDYGQYDDLIRTLSRALGPTGLDQLKERFRELSEAPLEKPKDKDRRVIGWGVGGALYADEISSRGRETTIRLALQEIADAQGDVDAFIAQQSEATTTVPRVAAEIAR